MSTTVAILGVFAFLLFAYFLSAGIAFALMYRIGRRFPSRAAGVFCGLLESLSRRSRAFGRLYNGLCVWSYRLIIRGPLYGGWPPPPPSL